MKILLLSLPERNKKLNNIGMVSTTKDKNLDITAIIPAAGHPTNKIIFNNNLPDAMLPINGKPVIGYIIEDLISRLIENIVVVLNSHDQSTEKYISRKYGERCNLKVVYDLSEGRGLGYAMYLASKYTANKHILVYLGDTIYKGPLVFKKSFLVVIDKYDDSSKWCFAEKKGKEMLFINKPQFYRGQGKVICGLYYFHQANIFRKIVEQEEKKRERLEMHHLLASYSKKDPFLLTQETKWYDCGNIENYYQAKIDFLRLRGFNSIKYDSLYGIITKTGIRSTKIKNEINWYRGLPDKLKIFTPRLIDYKINKNRASYSLEFYGYQSLDDIFIFGYLDEKIWKIIIDHLLDIVSLFRQYKKIVPLADYEAMYQDKIIERVEELKQDRWWSELLAFPEVYINGRAYKNISHFLPRIKNIAKLFYSKKDMGLVHGDLCLNNILFDPGNRLFKLIDPRGSFGRETIYGDTKYDLAKIRFSLTGHYDFIVSDLFKVSVGSELNNISYNVYSDDYHYRIGECFDRLLAKRGFNLKKIRMIEALLFLSVIPHHYDYPDRQKAMYVTAIKLLNEIF